MAACVQSSQIVGNPQIPETLRVLTTTEANCLAAAKPPSSVILALEARIQIPSRYRVKKLVQRKALR